ncbi:AP2-like ethylene-responsive transcription factor AIL7 [Typha angustifolia]|uniref:AP2-like ethylene-responsive transcription factor AIL7 n=1 Tax=Typha angustifolia TaxID=59011 RepID=UPI003C2DA21A
MAPTNNWISFSFPPMEMLLRPYAYDHITPPHDQHYQFFPQAMDDLMHASPSLDPIPDAPADGQSSPSLAAANPSLLLAAEVADSSGSATAGKSPDSDGAITVAAYPPPILAVAAPASKAAVVGSCNRTSVFRGVTRHRWTGRYEAHLWDNTCRREGQKRKGRQVYLGGYDKEEKAARAYDLAALKYWGPTATTNFPVENYMKEIEEMEDMTKQEYIASLRRKSSGFSRGASIYRGVTRHHQHGRWQARIGRVAGNKDLYLGTFATEEEAAEAYDVAAIKFRGTNAVTNFELSRYDVEAIASTDLPIGATARKIKQSLQESNQLSFDGSPIQQHPNTFPPALFHNLIQLRNSGISPTLPYYSLGETNPDACSQGLYWFADSDQRKNQLNNSLAMQREFSN